MKKLLTLVLFFSLMALTMPAAADTSAENMPVIGAAIGIAETPYSIWKNVVSCKGFMDCVFGSPGHVMQGGLNGAERIVGTTVLPFSYKRDFGKNGVLAKNKILPNALGYAGVGLGLYYTLPHAAHITLFGMSEASTLVVLGAAAGVGYSAIEMSQSGWKFD